MYKILVPLLLVLHSGLFASELIRYPHPHGSLQERQKWAFETASKYQTFWIGYGVTKLMDPGSVFMSGVSINGTFRTQKGKPSLQERIYGIKTPPPTQSVQEAARAELDRTEKKREKVWKEIGVFQRFRRGSRIPDRSQLITLSLPANFDAPLFWLGKAGDEESFSYLTGLYSQMNQEEQKEDLMAGISLHPAKMAYPFLKKVLISNEPEEAQEAAAIFMGEMDTPEALQLLQQVAESNSYENVREAAVVGISEMRTEAALQVVAGIAKNHKDRELRETAIAMLADKQGGKATKVLEEIAWFDPDEDIRETAVVMLGESEAGVPALLKIMDDHPSKETRETAIHILAETVAGRKILKEKVKQ